MADDGVTYEVITDYISRGITSGTAELNRLKNALKELLSTNQITEKQFKSFSKTLGSMGKSLKMGQIQAVSKEFAGMVQSVDAASHAFQRLAQAQRGQGNLTPAKGAIAGIDIQKLREDVATYEALNADYISEAKKRISANDKMVASEKNLRAAQATNRAGVKDNAAPALTKEEQATEKLAKANRELAAAKRASTAARKTGDEAKIAAALDKQTAATNKVTAAQRRMAQVQAQAGKSAGALHTQLPRLRYALYDVSATATIVGAAMVGLAGAVFLTATRMDRQFADVVRTSQTTGKAAQDLEDQFISLFQSIPTGWADLTQIGTLGGQLGVPADDLAEFTKLVVKFSATTNVAVDEAATAFGRLSQLLDVPAEKFENLGSAVLKVGVNSVATESQIIAVSSQIASIAHAAGFSADEVIGLSGALASLGTAPELARGSIVRLFTNINVAIANGSRKLEDFGEITGQTGKQFAQEWGTDASGALEKLLGRLGQLSSTDATQTLKDLGITAARDIPTYLKLAQNVDVLHAAMQDASSGFADASTLNQQYGVIAETVSSKLTVLRNNFQTFVATLGDSANSVGPVIDAITKMLQIMTALVNNPAAQWTAGLTLGLAALAGIVLIVAGGFLRIIGTVLGADTAIREYRVHLLETAAGLKGMASQSELAALSTVQLTAAVNKASGGMKGMGISAQFATGAIRALKIASVIGIALLALDAIFATTATSGQKLADVDLSNLSDALKQDTQVYADSGQNIALLTGPLQDAADSFDNVTTAANNSTVAVGEFTAEWLRQQFANSDLGSLIADSGATPAQTDQLINSILGDPSHATARIEEWYNQVFPAQKKAVDDFYSYAAEQSDKEGGAVYPDMPEQVAEAEALFGKLEGFAKTTGDAIVTQADKARTADFWGASTEGAPDAEQKWQAMIEMVHNAVSEFTDAENAILSTQNALYGLGQSLRDNGTVWSEFSAGGRANTGALIQVIQALAAETQGDVAATAANLLGLFNALVAGGYASAEQLVFLQGAIQNLKAEAANQGVTNIQANVIDLTSLFEGLKPVAEKSLDSVGKSANKAAKEIRTLKDYVSDLKSVFSDAFDFRFGFQISKDDFTSKVQDISDGFADAAQKVRDLKLEIQDLQATLSGLAADKGTLEYQLKVALKYGDTLRANEIQAELDKNNSDTAKTTADLTDKQKDLTKAQEDATPTLTGNTQAAIDQRAAVLDLVEATEDKIAAYAAEGHSAKEVAAYAKRLRGELAAQLKAWGYSTAEVKKYTAGIDDFIKIIGKVPRNLTVKADADTSPAQKALDIFFAENKNRNLSVGITPHVNGKVTPSDLTPTKPQMDHEGFKDGDDYGMAFVKRVSTVRGTLIFYKDGSKRYRLPDGSYTSKFFDKGGFTGRGGRLEAAGIVHKGEYVIPKHEVNQRTGLPYADAMGRLPASAPGGASYASGGPVNGNGVLQVELVPRQMRQLAAGQSVTLVADGKVLAKVVDNAHTNEGARSN